MYVYIEAKNYGVNVSFLISAFMSRTGPLGRSIELGLEGRPLIFGPMSKTIFTG